MAIRANRRPVAEPERHEWETTGREDDASTLERHRDSGALRVRPAALAAAKRSWVASTPHAERTHWQTRFPEIAHECVDACNIEGDCPDTPEVFPF